MAKSLSTYSQHTIRERDSSSKNIISLIEGKPGNKKVFDYKTKGMMASIGKEKWCWCNTRNRVTRIYSMVDMAYVLSSQSSYTTKKDKSNG